MLREAHAEVREILAAHRSPIEELARLLVGERGRRGPSLQATLKVRNVEQINEKRKPADASKPD